MAKFVLQEKSKGTYTFECPGCGYSHAVWTVQERYPHPIWYFNGDVDKPTVHPSFLVTRPVKGVNQICHSYITSGRIQFLSDCTHELKGQTVELPEIAVN